MPKGMPSRTPNTKLRVIDRRYLFRKASCSTGWFCNVPDFESHCNSEQFSFSRDVICKTLQSCTKRKDLALGRQVYSSIFIHGLDADVFLGDHIIRFFASCGSISEAAYVFQGLPNPSVFTWNAIIGGHTKFGHNEKAIELFCIMQKDVEPDKISYLYAIKACSSIGYIVTSRLLHGMIVRSGIVLDVVIGSAIVNMYCKCGNVEDARKVFDQLPDQNEILCNAMIAGYAEIGDVVHTFDLFNQMQARGLQHTTVSLLYVLKACYGVGYLKQGRVVHDHIIKSQLESDVMLSSTLVEMYVKNGSLDEAHKVFNGVIKRDLVLYSILIVGYTQHGHGFSAMELFSEMLEAGLKPDKVTFSSIMKGCGTLGALLKGRHMHDQIVREGYELDVVVGSSLIDMYAECGSLDEAQKCFITLPNKNIVSWGALVTGCVQHGNITDAINILLKMQSEGLRASKPMFLCILKACSSRGQLANARTMHAQIAKSELIFDKVIGSAVVDMYIKCGSLKEALQVFNELPNRDSITWGSMISGCAQHNQNNITISLFLDMQQEGIESSNVIFSAILKACGSTRLLDFCRLVHGLILENNFESDVVVGSTLIDTYVKCGILADARFVFESLPERDVVSWGVIISGYAQHDHDIVAFELFERMQQEGINPAGVTTLCILKSCAITGSIKQGRLLHNLLVYDGLQLDVMVGTALLEMYAKCGCIQDAQNVFDSMPSKTVVSWSTLIAAYAWSANFNRVQLCLDELQQHGLKPVDAMFTSILAACSHAGISEEGCRYFQSMIETYDIMPKVEHFNCMADIFAREGRLHDAEDVLQTMPICPDPVVWTSLLNASRTYGNVPIGSRCFTEAVNLDSTDASSYTIMCDIYNEFNMYENADYLQRLKNCSGAMKPGKAWIELGDKVNEFIVGDKSHPHNDDITTKRLSSHNVMKLEGYSPCLDPQARSVTECECEPQTQNLVDSFTSI